MKAPMKLMTMATTTLAAATLLFAGEGRAAPLRNQSGPYEMQVLVGGVPAQTFYHAGETYVLGHGSERYTLRVVNHTGRRIEAVVSVDGRDVVDGRPANFGNKRGYLVPAWGQVDIDGWRLSQGQAAAFRFSSVADSYAGRTGSAREVGVIGVAVFPERYDPPRPVYTPVPRPWYGYRGEDRYAPRDDYDGRQNEAPAPARKSAGPSASAPPPPATTPQGGALGRSEAKPDMAYGERESERARRRPGLGTAFGEAVDSPIREVEFVRASPGRPSVLLGVRYNDYEGLLAMGVDVEGWRHPNEEYVRRTAEPFPGSERRYASPPPGWESR